MSWKIGISTITDSTFKEINIKKVIKTASKIHKSVGWKASQSSQKSAERPKQNRTNKNRTEPTKEHQNCLPKNP